MLYKVFWINDFQKLMSIMIKGNDFHCAKIGLKGLENIEIPGIFVMLTKP